MPSAPNRDRKRFSNTGAAFHAQILGKISMVGRCCWCCISCDRICYCFRRKVVNTLNLQVVTRTAAQLGIVAIGQTLVLISGRFDLSVGSIFGVCGVIFVPLVAMFGVWPAFILALLCGVIIGLLNGFLTERMGVPSLISTLGSLWIFQGAGLLHNWRICKCNPESSESIIF